MSSRYLYAMATGVFFLLQNVINVFSKSDCLGPAVNMFYRSSRKSFVFEVVKTVLTCGRPGNPPRRCRKQLILFQRFHSYY